MPLTNAKFTKQYKLYKQMQLQHIVTARFINEGYNLKKVINLSSHRLSEIFSFRSENLFEI